jgi:hypothetical protein
MSYTAHSRCSNPHWLFPAIETNDEETPKAPDLSPFYSDDESTNDTTLRDFDAALEHVALERCCVCPLCGAIVSNDGSVMS